jgi:hypothetical protein
MANLTRRQALCLFLTKARYEDASPLKLRSQPMDSRRISERVSGGTGRPAINIPGRVDDNKQKKHPFRLKLEIVAKKSSWCG